MPRVYRLEVISRTVLILICVGLATGCGSTRAANGKTAVVAAFYPLAFAAEQVAGTSADIEDLTPSGAEPHDIELAPQAVARIERADVVLYLGHGFQPAVSDAVRNASGRAVDVLEGLPLHSGSGQDQDLTADPHVWLDPVLFERVVVDIAAALHRRAAAAPLLRRLSTLDRQYRVGLRHCARKEIVTSHAAFAYLARRYGLHQVAITGLAPESEPTPRRLADVGAIVRRTHATTVFFERLISPRLAQTVAREAGARTAVLDPIEGLTPAEQARGDTYLSIMRRNLRTLRKALACR